jgi:hypothetical protein
MHNAPTVSWRIGWLFGTDYFGIDLILPALLKTGTLRGGLMKTLFDFEWLILPAALAWVETRDRVFAGGPSSADPENLLSALREYNIKRGKHPPSLEEIWVKLCLAIADGKIRAVGVALPGKELVDEKTSKIRISLLRRFVRLSFIRSATYSISFAMLTSKRSVLKSGAATPPSISIEMI